MQWPSIRLLDSRLQNLFLLGGRHFRDGFEYPGESGVALEPPCTASCRAGVQPAAWCLLWFAIVSFCGVHGDAIDKCLHRLYTKNHIMCTTVLYASRRYVNIRGLGHKKRLRVHSISARTPLQTRSEVEARRRPTTFVQNFVLRATNFRDITFWADGTTVLSLGPAKTPSR